MDIARGVWLVGSGRKAVRRSGKKRERFSWAET
jgi:hypothetical protein